MKTWLKMGLITLAAGASISAHANLISNGSFETPDVDNVNNNGGSSWEVFSSIDGWYTESGTGIEIQKSGTVVNAFDGDQYVELDSHDFSGEGASTNSFMVQNISGLTANSAYELSFWYQPRTNRENDNGISVHWAGVGGDLEDAAFTTVDGQRRSFGGWQNFTAVLVATGTEMNLGFQAFGNDNTLGGFLDMVSLVEVPEPATIGLLAIGIIGLGAARRKKA